MGRTLIRAGDQKQIRRAVRAGQHQHAVQTRVHRARDVGVQPVAHEDRTPGSEPGHRVVEQRPVRLARYLRRDRNGHGHRGDRRPVARDQPTVGRSGGIGVGGHPVRPAVDGDRRLVQLLPGQLEAPALQHSHRCVVGRPDPHQADLRECGGDPFTTDHEHPCAGTEPVEHQVRTGLGRRDHVVGRGRDAELHQVGGNRRRRPGGIVGDEAHPGAPPPQGGDPLRGAGHRHRPQVDDAVQVEQRGVVTIDDREPPGLSGGVRGGRPPRR